MGRWTREPRHKQLGVGNAVPSLQHYSTTYILSTRTGHRTKRTPVVWRRAKRNHRWHSQHPHHFCQLLPLPLLPPLVVALLVLAQQPWWRRCGGGGREGWIVPGWSWSWWWWWWSWWWWWRRRRWWRWCAFDVARRRLGLAAAAAVAAAATAAAAPAAAAAAAPDVAGCSRAPRGSDARRRRPWLLT